MSDYELRQRLITCRNKIYNLQKRIKKLVEQNLEFRVVKGRQEVIIGREEIALVEGMEGEGQSQGWWADSEGD